MTYLAIVSSTIDDIPLGLFLTYEDAERVARHAYDNPELSLSYQHAAQASGRDCGNPVAYQVVVFNPDGTLNNWHCGPENESAVLKLHTPS